MRIRIVFHKTEPLRYTSNLDMQKIWERTFRRAYLPLTYSQGFHPQPKIHQACPLPTGFLSRHELLDFWLEETYPIEHLNNLISSVVQPGILIQSLSELNNDADLLQNAVSAVAYQVELLSSHLPEKIYVSINNLLAYDSIPRVRRGKQYDLRPLVEELSLNVNGSDRLTIMMRLSARQGATGRPEEVLDQLGLDPLDARYTRTETLFY